MVFQNHKSRSFRVRRGVPQGFVLGLVLFSLFINVVPASLPFTVKCSLYTDDLAIWSSSPHPLLRWRPHKELCFDWSAGLSTGVFFSIRANVRPPCFQWMPTRLTSSLTFFCTTPASVSTKLKLFLGSPLTALFPFLNTSSLMAKFFPRLKALRCISASSWGPSMECLYLLYKAFLRHLLTYASPGWFPFLSVTNITKLERLHQAASRAITGCLLSSPIPILPSEASLPLLRVTLTHFALSSISEHFVSQPPFPFLIWPDLE